MKYVTKRKKTVASDIDLQKVYTLEEAVGSIEKFPATKFDETVELHLHLGIDPKNSDQQVRGTVVLPNGLGKEVKVAVFCKGELSQKAKDAGADFVGAEELIDKVSKGFLDFDVVVATPDMMRDISKLGKVLGPRGLMPTPKAGTVTTDVEKAINELKAGKIEFKADKQAGIHVAFGKRSFAQDKLLENANDVVKAIQSAKPNSFKGVKFIKGSTLSTTMGPGLKVSL